MVQDHATNALTIERGDDPVSKRIGLIVLATDHTTERDFTRLCDPDDVGVYVNRIAFENPTTADSLKQTGPRLTSAAAQILPGEQLDVIAYSCTAASVILGDPAVQNLIHIARPEAAVVTPASAAFAAFVALKVNRVSVLTPYIADVTLELVTYFSDHGLDVVSSMGLGLEDDRQMARVTPSSIITAGEQAIDDDADALFISCTALQAVVCVSELERRIGKPVITSNQAMIWRSLRLAGNNQPISGYGRLFEI